MRKILVCLLGFLSLGAIYGGIVFIIKTDGSVYEITSEIYTIIADIEENTVNELSKTLL